jgi:predicted DNA-binding transcriptional regulator AlpA
MNLPVRKWLSRKQACAVAFGVSVHTIARWVAAGHFPPPAVGPGGTHRYLADEVAKWLAWQAETARAKREGQPAPPAPQWADPLAVLTAEPIEADCDV